MDGRMCIFLVCFVIWESDNDTGPKATLSRYFIFRTESEVNLREFTNLTLTLTNPNPHWAQLACDAHPGDLWIVP
jgi:hypothetical protein